MDIDEGSIQTKPASQQDEVPSITLKEKEPLEGAETIPIIKKLEKTE